MIRIILIVIILAALFGVIRWFTRTPASLIARYLRQAFIVMLILVLLVLAATGRLPWLFPLLGALFAFCIRMFPYLLRYAPVLHRFWAQFRASRASRGSEGRSSAAGAMSVEEAYRVLGLKQGATRGEIIEAHRRLIQKMHPDRGGSDYLAAKLNQAKDILLGR